MRIWVDGYEANVAQRLGSGQVAFELISNFEKLDKKNEYTILLSSEPMEDMPRAREGFKYKILKPSKLKTFLAIPFAYFKEKNKPDVIFSPTHYIPRFVGAKRVATIFDLSFLRFKQMFKGKDLYQLTNWTKYTVFKANHLITISKFSKLDIIKTYKLSKNKITVAYPGYDKKIFHPITDAEKIKKVLEEYNIVGDYIIYIGTLQPRKNLIRLMEAVSRIEGLKLVVVGKTRGEGKQGWMYEEILRAPGKLGISDRVIFTGFAKTSNLPILLSGAKASVLVSLWEGFGIPPLESMACGTPAIVSNVSSLPEVVGNAGLLVDPEKTDQIEQAIRVMVSDTKLRAKLSKLGIERAKKFSWEKMARDVIKVFENI